MTASTDLHIFKPSEEDKDFCERCGENFRSEIHERADFTRCSCCGTPWESWQAAATCPCLDNEEEV